MNGLTFDQQFRSEISKIRGAYLDMSCDLEFLLVDITCVCLIRNEKERNYIKEIMLSGLMLSKKIKSAKSALRVYNNEYLKNYESCFTDFNILNDLRNRFTHSRAESDNEQKNLDIIRFISFKDGAMIETIESRRELYLKLQTFAASIYKLGSELIPILYTERHVKRYSNILQYPSNMSMSVFHNLLHGTNQ